METAKATEQNGRRLDSWKEIAAHFGRDVRTVRRWEVERALPVHRVPGTGRGRVFAYAEELERWLHSSGPSFGPTSESSFGQGSAQAPAAIPVELERLEEAPAGNAAFGQASGARVTSAAWRGDPGAWSSTSTARWTMLFLLGTLTALLGAGLVRSRRVEATSSGSTPLPRPVAGDAVTQELYLRGRYLWNQRTKASLTEAANVFSQAIARDPQCAGAYAGLAETYLLLRQYGDMPDGEAYPRAYAASERAVQLDDRAVEAHRALGFVLNFWVWDFRAAEREFQRAIELDPRDAQSHQWYASSLWSVGRDQDALKEIDAARQLQPDSVAILASRGFFLRRTRPAAARAALDEVVRTQPEFAYAHRYLALVYLDAELYPEFLKELRGYFVLVHGTAELAVVGQAERALEDAGPRAMFRELAGGFGAMSELRGNPHAMDAAEYYAHLRDAEKTLHFVSLSCERRESNFQGLPSFAAFQFLNGNAEFQSLLARSRTPLDRPDAVARLSSASGPR